MRKDARSARHVLANCCANAVTKPNYSPRSARKCHSSKNDLMRRLPIGSPNGIGRALEQVDLADRIGLSHHQKEKRDPLMPAPRRPPEPGRIFEGFVPPAADRVGSASRALSGSIDKPANERAVCVRKGRRRDCRGPWRAIIVSVEADYFSESSVPTSTTIIAFRLQLLTCDRCAKSAANIAIQTLKAGAALRRSRISIDNWPIAAFPPIASLDRDGTSESFANSVLREQFAPIGRLTRGAFGKTGGSATRECVRWLRRNTLYSGSTTTTARCSGSPVSSPLNYAKKGFDHIPFLFGACVAAVHEPDNDRLVGPCRPGRGHRVRGQATKTDGANSAHSRRLPPGRKV